MMVGLSGLQAWCGQEKEKLKAYIYLFFHFTVYTDKEIKYISCMPLINKSS